MSQIPDGYAEQVARISADATNSSHSLAQKTKVFKTVKTIHCLLRNSSMPYLICIRVNSRE
jgi:hypothetical protein